MTDDEINSSPEPVEKAEKHVAAFDQNVCKTQLAAAGSAKPVKRNKNRNPPLSEHEQQLHLLCDKGPDDAATKVGELLRFGDVRVECANEHSITPLMSAAYRGFYNISKALIDAGADVNSNAHDDYYTPLHFAALSGRMQVVKLLLEHGARTTVVNGMGKAASDLAAFVGHRACSSTITNYCSIDAREYYTTPHGFEREPKLPPHLLDDMQALVTLRAVHPIKLEHATLLFRIQIINTLQEHPQLLTHAQTILNLLRTLITKNIKDYAGDEMCEKLAVKLHVFACVLRYVTVDNNKQRSITELQKALVVGTEPYGEMATLERFLRSCLGTFEYPESLLLRVCVKALVHSNEKNKTSAMCALTQGVFGLMSKDGDEDDCCVCGGVEKNAKLCGNCHSATYCSRQCQQLHWFTHKKFCQKLQEKNARETAKCEQRRREHLQEREQQLLADEAKKINETKTKPEETGQEVVESSGPVGKVPDNKEAAEQNISVASDELTTKTESIIEEELAVKAQELHKAANEEEECGSGDTRQKEAQVV